MSIDIENELQLANWLSIVSFDLHKYIKAGGSVTVSAGENGLNIQLIGVQLDDGRLHRKFRASIENEE